MKKSNKLTLYIIIAMIAGSALGYFVHEKMPTKITAFSDNIKLLTDIFIRLIQMIIAPLVFTTLVVGIAKLGDLKTVGRVGGKAMLWFISASLVSLLIGLILVNIFEPGAGLKIDQETIKKVEGTATSIAENKSFSLKDFIP